MGPKALQLLVVAGALEALFEHDRELPLGEDDVVVHVVDLAARHLRVVGEDLVLRRHAGHVDVARLRGVGRGRVLGPALDDPAQVELGVADRAHLPVDDRGQARGRAVAVHHVGELVVAVHQPGDEVERAVLAQPLRRDVEARQLPALDPLEERGPAVDLAFVEPVGTPEVLEALGLPVHVRQQRDALHQLVRQPGPGFEIGVERRGQ